MIDKEPSNFDSVDKEPGNLNILDDHWSNLGPVPGYQSTAEEIKPGTADQGSDDRVPAVPDSLMELRPDFRETVNLREKMERVGIAAQGKTLSPNEVAKLLTHQGQYRSRMRNLRSKVRWVMRNSPLQYEKIDEDTFLFISTLRKTPGYPPA